MNKLLDTSEEFLLHRYKAGITLVKPDKDTHLSSFATGHTVKSVLAFPFCSYFIDKNSIKVNLNEHSAYACGFSSSHDGIGKSVMQSLDYKSALGLINNNTEVVNTNRIKIVEEHASHINNNLTFEGLTIKVPWYDEYGILCGVFGCSIRYDMTTTLPEFLEKITQLNLLASPNMNVPHTNLPGIHIDNVYFTKREKNILEMTMQGRSARVIAGILHISRRTVEYHLDNIKNKLNVNSKSELIDKMLKIL